MTEFTDALYAKFPKEIDQEMRALIWMEFSIQIGDGKNERRQTITRILVGARKHAGLELNNKQVKHYVNCFLTDYFDLPDKDKIFLNNTSNLIFHLLQTNSHNVLYNWLVYIFNEDKVEEEMSFWVDNIEAENEKQ